jgi:hypothetical protein
MKTLSLFAAVAFLAAAPAFAQTAAVPATPAAPAPPAAAPAAPSLTKDGKPRMKDVRATCKSESEAAGLKGDARKSAMADCMIKQRPDKAAAIRCRMDPAMKGMDKDARKTAMQACVAKAKG